MTVQIANTVSMTVTYSSRQSSGAASESFESFLETGGLKSTDVQITESQPSVSEKQKGGEIDAQETAGKTSANAAKDEMTSGNVKETVDSTETDVTVTNLEVTEVELPEEKELTEDILAEILSVLNEFVSVLQNELQITEQQLSDVAGEIQFGLTDFFDADRMKELFLYVNQVEASELLTDENLYKSLELLQNTLSEVLENSELYQLLQQDGFEPEQFDMSAFASQISEFALEKAMPEAIVETVETVIEFDNEWLKLDNAGSETVQTSVTGTGANMVDVISEKEGGTDSDTMNQSFDSERGQEQAGLFLQKLVSAAVKESATESIQNVSAGFELYDIASQIIDQVKLQIRPDNAKMEIQLNPEHLGKVELEVSSKNGELSARLNVQNDQVKEAVESQMQILRDTLEAQGLKVENIEVTVAEFGFRFQDEQGSAEQFQQEQHRRNSLQFDETDSEEQSFSDVSEVMKELNGNSVDYVA